MQLIECGDCHKQISDEAYSCPHCGKPMQRRSRWMKPMMLFALPFLCVILPLFALVFLYLSRTVWHNMRSSLKGVGEDLLRRF